MRLDDSRLSMGLPFSHRRCHAGQPRATPWEPGFPIDCTLKACGRPAEKRYGPIPCRHAHRYFVRRDYSDPIHDFDHSALGTGAPPRVA
jgi:hypothetical protein